MRFDATGGNLGEDKKKKPSPDFAGNLGGDQSKRKLIWFLAKFLCYFISKPLASRKIFLRVKELQTQI